MSVESLPSLPVLDLDGALNRLGGDQQLFLELVTIVLEDIPALFQQLQIAANKGDAPQMRSTAHALKGLAAGCGGVRAASVASALENAAAQGELAEIDQLVESLELELAPLIDALQAQLAR